MSKAQKPNVTDIPHEVVEKSNGLSHVPKFISPEDQIKLEIAKFNVAESGIESLKQQYGELTISGSDDKVGYKKVRDAWSEVRGTRTKLEKKGLELRNGYGVITKAIKKEEERLIELITPLEEQLYKSWKEIDEAKEKIQREKEEEEHRQTMVRVEEILSLGASFRDGFYCVGDTISVDVASLRLLPADQYEKLKGAITAKAEELAKAEAEAAAERQREADRLQQEKEELLRQQEEMRIEREKMEKEREAMFQEKEAAKKMKVESRVDQLRALGMVDHRGDYIFENCYRDIKVFAYDIVSTNDIDFSDLLFEKSVLVNEVKALKESYDQEQQEKKIAADKKRQYIAHLFEQAKINFSYTAQSFQWENDVEAISITLAELMPLEDAQITELVDKFVAQRDAAIAASKKRAEERQAEADREAKLNLKDKERYDLAIIKIENALVETADEDYKLPKYKKLINKLQSDMTSLLKEFK